MASSTKITARARRTKVAANLLSPHPLPPEQLAPQLGITAEHTANLQRDPRTREIAQNLLEPHRQRISGMIPRSLDAIEQALKAMTPGGRKADHLMRLRAVDRLRKMVELIDFHSVSDNAAKEAADRAGGTLRGTLEDFVLEYRRLTVERSAPD
jgi:hypothetical protein